MGRPLNRTSQRPSSGALGAPSISPSLLWQHSRERGEVRALRWSDLDVTAKTLRIERAIELTEARGLTIKPPKTKRGFREITIDDDLIALLMGTREAPADRRRCS